MRYSYRKSHMFLWSRGLAKSHNKLLILMIHYCSAYGHQTRWVVTCPKYLLSVKSQNPLIMCFSTSWDKLKTYISTAKMSMVTKIEMIVTYHEMFSAISSNDPLITWSCKITWQTKVIKSPLTYCLKQQNLAGWWIVLSSFHQ